MSFGPADSPAPASVGGVAGGIAAAPGGGHGPSGSGGVGPGIFGMIGATLANDPTMNPMYSASFRSAIRAGASPSAAAGYASHMGSPTPSLNAIRGVQALGLGSLFGPLGAIMGVPNPMGMAFGLMGIPGKIGMPTSPVAPGMPGPESPGGGIIPGDFRSWPVPLKRQVKQFSRRYRRGANLFNRLPAAGRRIAEQGRPGITSWYNPL